MAKLNVNGRVREHDAEPDTELLRRVECCFGGELVFAADLHAAISANPCLALHLKVPRAGSDTVTWHGDRGLARSETVRTAVA